MTPIYSRRALADLRKIGAYYASTASPAVAHAIEQRLGQVIEHIGQNPHAARALPQRPNIRVLAVVNYPFQIFYRAHAGTIEIVHIRHTSRRPRMI